MADDSAAQRYTDRWVRDPALHTEVIDLVQDAVNQDPEIARYELGEQVIELLSERGVQADDLDPQEVGDLAHEQAIEEGVFR